LILAIGFSRFTSASIISATWPQVSPLDLLALYLYHWRGSRSGWCPPIGCAGFLGACIV